MTPTERALITVAWFLYGDKARAHVVACNLKGVYVVKAP